MKYTLLIFALALLTLVARGQKIVITGNAPGAEKKRITLTAPADLVTFTEKRLASAQIDSIGNFRLEVDTNITLGVTIAIDSHKADLFIEPGKTYGLRIVPLAYEQYQEINPFVQSQNLTVELPDAPADDLNFLIGRFTTFYSGFLTENFNALYRERKKILLDTFRVQMNRYFGDSKNPFFLDYASYKIAALEQLTQYYSKPQLARKYFTERDVLYANPEYMDFFNSFFSKYLTASSLVLRKTDYASLLRSPDPYKSMMKTLAADSVLRNEPLRELVMLKGLMELYDMPYPQDAVLALMGSVAERSAYPGNREVARNMVKLITRLKPGTPAPDFTLLNREQKEWTLSSLKGKPVVLFFWTTYCEGCLSEMDLIRPLYDKYRENVHFVGVSGDKYFSKMLFFINMKPDYIWTFVNVGDKADVLRDYDVRGYPLFVIIDRNGKIFRHPASLPSGNLEAEILKVME